MSEQNISDKEVEKSLMEKKWQEAQIKGLTAWVNTYLNKAKFKPVVKLPDDIKDGVRLIQFLSCVVEGKSMGDKYIKAPKTRIQQIENCSLALKFVTNDLGVRLIGIGAEDIVDGEMKLILGLLWSSFRKLSLGRLSTKEGKSKPEDDLLNWIREMTDGYDGVNIRNFRDSFNDGLAWGALIDRFDPAFLDFNTLDPKKPEANLNKVFEAAESKLGIPKLFDAKDLIEGKCDERTIVLYSSLFYHAWSQDKERIALANKRRGMSQSVTELQSRLEKEIEELKRSTEERDSLLKQKTAQESDAAERKRKLEELEETIQRLKEERERLRHLLEEERQARLKRASEETERLRKKQGDLRKRVRDEQKTKDELGRENVELLAQNRELKERLRKAGMGGGKDGISNSLDGLEFGSADLSLLRGLLRDHVTTLHQQWKATQEAENDTREKKLITLERTKLIKEIKDIEKSSGDKSPRASKTHLDPLFAERNKTMVEIHRVKDAVNELAEFVDKKGVLIAQVEGKRWKNRFFVLRGFFLSYYNKQEDINEVAEGELNLENTTAEKKDFKESKEGKPKYGIRFKVKENPEDTEVEELLVGSKTQDERDEWLALLQGRIVYLQYLALAEKERFHPDIRVISLLASQRISNIDLDNRPLSSGVLKILASLIKIHPEVENISLSNANLSDDEIAALGDVIENAPKLRQLDLSKNQLKSESVEHLAKALSGHKSLSVLNLSHNQIIDISKLADIAKSNTELRSIGLSHNFISDSSMKELRNGLSNVQELSTLTLDHNKISNDGAREVAKILAEHKNLESVHLEANLIGDEGAIGIFEVLANNHSVKEVNLADNEIGTKGISALKSLFDKNKFVQVVEVCGMRNLIGGEGLEIQPDVEVPKFSFRQH